MGDGVLTVPTVLPRRQAATWAICAFALIAPVMTGLQPYLPSFLQVVSLHLRESIGPLILLWILRDHLRVSALGALVVLLGITSFAAISTTANDVFLVAAPLLGGVLFFQAGRLVSQRDDLRFAWVWLARGATIVNLLTIAVYVGILLGVLDLAFFLDVAQRPEDAGLARFSFGNPIELPLLLTSLLYAAQRQDGSGRSYVFDTGLNLVVALVSESRVVVLAAAILFIGSLGKLGWRDRVIVLLLMAGLGFVARDHVADVLGSLGDRFGGNDYGSADDRKALVGITLDNLTPVGLLFGNGLTSSFELLQFVIHEHRSVESVVLQCVYEIGLLGIGLLLISVRPVPGLRAPRWSDGALWLLWAQILFFVPIFNLMGPCLFGLACYRPLTPRLPRQ
jgi:hypothetical protein